MGLIGTFLRAAPLQRRLGVLDAALEYLPDAAYQRLTSARFDPAGIIDIGAHRGEWARLVHKFFPHAPILMIEARKTEEAWLKRAVAKSSPSRLSRCPARRK